jgi:multidrug transporter EmrE-like cation transporter
MPYFLITANIALMCAGQLLFKKAAIFLVAHPELSYFNRFLLNLWFYPAVFLFAVATLTWTQILTTMKLSVAYPILSISYIITAVAAYYFFGEKISVLNWTGIFIILVGVSLVSAK